MERAGAEDDVGRIAEAALTVAQLLQQRIRLQASGDGRLSLNENSGLSA